MFKACRNRKLILPFQLTECALDIFILITESEQYLCGACIWCGKSRGCGNFVCGMVWKVPLSCHLMILESSLFDWVTKYSIIFCTFIPVPVVKELFFLSKLNLLFPLLSMHVLFWLRCMNDFSRPPDLFFLVPLLSLCQAIGSQGSRSVK